MRKYLFLSFSLFLFIFVSLFFVHPSITKAGPGFANGTLLKSPKHTSVYQYQDNKRHVFVNSNVYYTWYSNFDNVETISVKQMEDIQLGDPMPIKPETKLLKFPLNPKIYAVYEGAVIKHIPDEYTAKAMFGNNWVQEVIELPEIYYLFYTQEAGLDTLTNNDLVNSTDNDCANGTLKFTSEVHDFVLCYENTGSVVEVNDGYVSFGVNSKTKYLGLLETTSNYDTVDSYIDFLSFGIMQIPVPEKNMYGTESQVFPGGTVDSMQYHVIIQNPDTKEIFHFYHSLDGTEFENAKIKDFMDGLSGTFRFL